jgi:L-rhamnose-H+ transport protein
MVSSVTLALMYCAGAGITNGSFAVPSKHIKTWNFENIWMNYAIWAFLILPWATIFMLDARVGDVYQNIPSHMWLILLGGGFLFGVGQVCFALALRTIGISLGFVINIGLAAGLGSLFPLFSLGSNYAYSSAGLLTITSVALIVVGLLFSYSAGRARDRLLHAQQSIVVKKGIYRFNVFLAILAGIISAGQNITFSATQPLQQMASAQGIDPLAISILIWPPFLTCSLIPYAMYMIYLHKKNNSFKLYGNADFARNTLLGVVMAICWFSSLAVYSKASLMIGKLGPIIAWPLFMVLIIMTSHAFGRRHQEWQGCSRSIHARANLSVFCLIFAVILLACSAGLA